MTELKTISVLLCGFVILETEGALLYATLMLHEELSHDP